MSLVPTYLKFKYLEPVVVVDPTVDVDLVGSFLFQLSIQALINKMMCHPATSSHHVLALGNPWVS